MAGHYPQCFVQIPDLSVAVGLPALLPGTRAIRFEAVGGTVRWLDTGEDPTSTVGNLLADGAAVYYELGGLQDLRFILASSTPVLNVTYYSGKKETLSNVPAGPVALVMDELTCAGVGAIS